MVHVYPDSSHELIIENSSTYGATSSIAKISNINKRNHDENIESNIFSNPTEANDEQHEDDFFKSIKGFLIFGKLIGVLPFSGTFGQSWKSLSYRKRSISAMLSYVIVAVLAFNVVMGLIEFYQAPKRNALELSNSIRTSVFDIWGLSIYVTFLYKGQMFLRIFKVWNSISVIYSRKDKALRRDVFLIAGGIFTSAILENLVLHLEYVKGLDSISGHKYKGRQNNMTVLETFYRRAHGNWANVIGYNWFFAVLSFFHHKWILYAWNYMDITLAVFGRAMYFRFQCLYEEAEKKLLGSEESRFKGFKVESSKDYHAWAQIVNDHKNLCRLLEVLENFFSPLMFAAYVVNILYIGVQLLDGLTSELSKHSYVHSIYAPWSFIHLVVRTNVASICCAYINVYAHKIGSILQECPPDLYSKNISRLYTRVTAGPDIGLTGLGCFTVTKPFILSLLSVIFTFEIVLLQCVPST